MARASPEPVAVAILAKAPLPGFAKTRLAAALGADGAAALQARFIARATETARAAGIGPVTLWAAPDEDHPAFQTLAALFGVAARAPARRRPRRLACWRRSRPRAAPLW